MHHSIELIHVHVRLGNVVVLKGVDVEAKPCEFISIVGANGAGKLTFLDLLLVVVLSLAIQIDTGTSPENLIVQARKIAAILKTEKEEQIWEERFLEKLRNLQKQLSTFYGKRVVVHKFAQSFAQWAGLSTVQVILPGELSPKVIGDAIAKKPDLVVDIYHFPIAKVIAENAKCKYIQVINFPGVKNTKTLEDIFECNSIQLLNAFQ